MLQNVCGCKVVEGVTATSTAANAGNDGEAISVVTVTDVQGGIGSTKGKVASKPLPISVGTASKVSGGIGSSVA